tara:strand:+ start:93 stop:350 length:258 start_codon:yes stop_codon:yes gene_type:complete
MKNSKKSAIKVQTVKRFVLSQKNIKDKDLILEFTASDGKTHQYSPSKVFAQLQDRFEAMPCWDKYKNYTNSKNLPKFVRDLETIV